jgi:hypothetical protein
MKTTPEEADRIRKAASIDRRSPLYLWMMANFDEFRDSVAEAGRPNWKSLATEFAALGLKDVKGNQPTPEGARQTWWQVRKAKHAKDTRRADAAAREVRLNAPANAANTTRQTPIPTQTQPRIQRSEHAGQPTAERTGFGFEPPTKARDQAGLISGKRDKADK